MPLFGSGLFGSPGSTGGSATVGVLFSELGMAAYRIAGITKWARVGPSTDMWDECIPAFNRMVGSWNCDRPKIFTVRLDTLPLIAGQMIYTVGDGADFDMPRPQAIQNGVVVLQNGVRVVPPMTALADEGWARISVQTIPSSIPQAYYYDGSFDASTGWSRIYLWPQAVASLEVDWYTWQALPVVASQDDTVALPPGYEEAITYNLAVRLASLNPLMANMPQESRVLARKALAAIESLNSKPPAMSTDFPAKRGGAGTFFWFDGSVR